MATIAHEYRRLLEAYADLTGADAAFIDWQAHDFSARGLSGPEDSMRAGFAHLCSFTGTDTVAAIDYAEQYYGADSDRELVGGSVPATEHSVMSMGGKLDEIGTFRRLITEVYPSGIVHRVRHLGLLAGHHRVRRHAEGRDPGTRAQCAGPARWCSARIPAIRSRS